MVFTSSSPTSRYPSRCAGRVNRSSCRNPRADPLGAAVCIVGRDRAVVVPDGCVRGVEYETLERLARIPAVRWVADHAADPFDAEVSRSSAHQLRLDVLGELGNRHGGTGDAAGDRGRRRLRGEIDAEADRYHDHEAESDPFQRFTFGFRRRRTRISGRRGPTIYGGIPATIVRLPPPGTLGQVRPRVAGWFRWRAVHPNHVSARGLDSYKSEFTLPVAAHE